MFSVIFYIFKINKSYFLEWKIILFLSKKSVFTDNLLLVNSCSFQFYEYILNFFMPLYMGLQMCNHYTRFIFLTFQHLAWINHYTICLPHSTYLNLSCISVGNHEIAYEQSLRSGSLFCAHQSDSMVPPKPGD